MIGPAALVLIGPAPLVLIGPAPLVLIGPAALALLIEPALPVAEAALLIKYQAATPPPINIRPPTVPPTAPPMTAALFGGLESLAWEGVVVVLVVVL